MTGVQSPIVQLGIYEKALVFNGDWRALFDQARDAGFAFVDLSIDESAERAARLEWTPAQRTVVREAAEQAGVIIGGLCLSLHRSIGPGSADEQTRQRALSVLLNSIDLAADLGAPVVQLAGYYAFYEEAWQGGRQAFVETMRAGARYAGLRGILLGLENVDGDDITSISSALGIVREIGSAWVRLYPDIGNLTERSQNPLSELLAGTGEMLAIHVKDTRPGEPRRVPFGEGQVPWDAVFRELAAQQWCGRMMIEMWNDDAPDSVRRASEAREFIASRLRANGYSIAGAKEVSHA